MCYMKKYNKKKNQKMLEKVVVISIFKQGQLRKSLVKLLVS